MKRASPIPVTIADALLSRISASEWPTRPPVWSAVLETEPLAVLPSTSPRASPTRPPTSFPSPVTLASEWHALTKDSLRPAMPPTFVTPSTLPLDWQRTISPFAQPTIPPVRSWSFFTCAEANASRIGPKACPATPPTAP